MYALQTRHWEQRGGKSIGVMRRKRATHRRLQRAGISAAPAPARGMVRGVR
jgi:hypothetical protein